MGNFMKHEQGGRKIHLSYETSFDRSLKEKIVNCKTQKTAYEYLTSFLCYRVFKIPINCHVLQAKTTLLMLFIHTS